MHEFLRRFADRCVDKPFEIARVVEALAGVYAMLGASAPRRDVTA